MPHLNFKKTNTIKMTIVPNATFKFNVISTTEI